MRPNFGTYSAQPPAWSRLRPHPAAHAGSWKLLQQTAKGAGQTLYLQVKAEGEGFEPSRTVTSPSGFQDRRHRPLGEPSLAPPALVGRGPRPTISHLATAHRRR